MNTPEYCLFWIDWWPMCMTKAEWAAWVAALGAIAAIAYAGRNLRLQFQHAEGQRVSQDLRENYRLLVACERVLEAVVAAHKSVLAKFAGEHEAGRKPHTAKERIDGLQAVITALLDKPIPPEAIPFLMEGMRVLGYSASAIRSTGRNYQAHSASPQISSARKRLKDAVSAKDGVTALLARCPKP